MLPLLAILWAQDAAPLSSDLFKTLGPFAAAVLICGAWIRDQGQRMSEKDRRIEQLTDRNVEMAERTLPLLTDVANLLRELLEENRRARRDR